MKRGFSLLEIVIGLFILGIIISSFFLFLKYSARESNFNLEQLIALQINQKVRETLTQEVKVNPYYIRSFSPPVQGKIVEIGHFFQNLQDRFPPWGRIGAEDNISFDDESNNLKVLNDFDASIGALMDPDNNIARVSLELNWPAKTGSGRKDIVLDFFYPQSVKTLNAPFLIDNTFESRHIAMKFFDSYQTLSALAPNKGFQERSVSAWGRLFFISDMFLNSAYYKAVKESLNNLNFMREAARTGGNLKQVASITLEICEIYHRLTQVALEILALATESMQIAQTTYDSYNLGGELWQNRYTKLKCSTKGLLTIEEIFIASVKNEIYEIIGLLTTNLNRFISAKKEQRLVVRLVEYLRLTKVLSDINFQIDNSNILNILEDKYKDKNLPITRLIIQEKGLLNQPKSAMLALFQHMIPFHKTFNSYSQFKAFVQANNLD